MPEVSKLARSGRCSHASDAGPYLAREPGQERALLRQGMRQVRACDGGAEPEPDDDQEERENHRQRVHGSAAGGLVRARGLKRRAPPLPPLPPLARAGSYTPRGQGCGMLGPV